METNIEIQTAEQNIEKLTRYQTQEAALYALSNEHEIIRMTKRIATVLEMLARDYGSMMELFSTHGETMVHEVKSELPKLAIQLKCRKEARSLYSDMLR